MTGATSPTGEKHPGVVIFDDRVDGSTETKRADDLPQFLIWAQQANGWKAVTRIEITGSRERRCITKFGASGELLETTITAPPPPRP